MRKYWFNIIMPIIIVFIFAGSWLVMNKKISLKMLPFFNINYHNAWDICLQGQFAYLAEGKGGMSVYDISNPAEPELCACISTKDFACNIFIHEHYAYIGDSDAGITIIDIKNPRNPEMVCSVLTQGMARDLIIKDNYLYLANGGRISVFEIKDFIHLNLVKHHSISGISRGLCISDSLLFAACDRYGIAIFNIIKPGDIQLRNQVLSSECAIEVSIKNGFAFIADRHAGMTILDISNPDSVNYVNRFRVESSSLGLYYNSEFVYLAVTKKGLYKLNVSDEKNIKLESFFPLNGYTRKVFIQDPYAFIAGAIKGLSVLNMKSKATMVISNQSR